MHENELCDLHATPNVMKIIEWRRWDGHVIWHARGKRKMHRGRWWAYVEQTDQFEDNGFDGRIILQGMQCIYKHNIEAHLHNHYCHRKEISITYSECVFVDLIIHSAIHMCLITLSSVACLAIPYFSILPQVPWKISCIFIHFIPWMNILVIIRLKTCTII